MIKHKIIIALILIIIVLVSGCNFNSDKDDVKNLPEVRKYVIDPSILYQTIDNFGASDAWSFKSIGMWPEEKQDQIATWLFSTENDEEGNPKGIGLSLWRFYIGAGSEEQGEKSYIDDKWRRNECFLSANGTYDWNKQKGQRHFLHEAKKHGVDQFLGFIYSAPVQYTLNGLATNYGRNGTFNLQPDKYDDFVKYIADIVEGIDDKEGILFNYISPFNEPDGHWNWDGKGQEGTAATKYEIAKTIRLLSKEFENRNIPTKILVPESSDLQCLYDLEPHIKYNRGYQIQSYFNPDSTDSYIGDLYNVPKLAVGHSYWTTSPIDKLRYIRLNLNKALEDNGVGFWQTEVCIMENDSEIGGGNKKDLTMKTALYVARVIHYDMVYANSSAWHWWLAVGTGDYKDGLVYAEPDKSEMDGTYTDSKLMWAFGNYSRFIRPGANRLDISAYTQTGEIIPEGDTDPGSLMISAYKNTDNSLVTVIINYSTEDETIELDTKGKSSITWQPYLTSDTPGDNLKVQPVIEGNKIEIPSKSIITLKEKV